MNANYDSSFSGWVIGGVKISMGPTESVFILANLITLHGQDQRLNCALFPYFMAPCCILENISNIALLAKTNLLLPYRLLSYHSLPSLLSNSRCSAFHLRWRKY